jgi:NitT/TauT family transport system permease protein
VAVVLVAWEIAAASGLTNVRFLSSPSRIIAAGVEEIQVPRFWTDVQISGFEFVVGYGLAVAAGVPLGIALGWYRRAALLVEPLINFLYATPRIALLPLVTLWLGLTIWSKVAVVFLGAFVTILLNTYLGTRTVDPSLLAVAQTFGARQSRIFKTVVLPGSIPFILVGLKLGVGRALIGVIVAELYGAVGGVGVMIERASHSLRGDRVLFGTLLFISVGVIMFELLRRVEDRFAPWRRDTTVAT